jgi:hypothetical protein
MEKRGNKVMLCTNFDEWGCETMNQLPDKTFEIYRMVPPGKVSFAFSVAASADEPKLAMMDYDEEQPSEDVDEVSATLKPPDAFDLTRVNTVVVRLRPSEAMDDIRLRPRTKADEPIPVKKKVVEVGWTLKNSVFAAYKSDTKKVLEAAFASDYDRSKAKTMEEKMSKVEEKATVRGELLSRFPVFKHAFRHYGAAYSNEVWTIGANAFGQFVHDLRILPAEEMEEGSSGGSPSKIEKQSSGLSNKCFNKVEADLIFVSACGNGNKTLNRSQFLDAIVMIASSRYVKFGTPPRTQAQAVEELAVSHIEKFAEKDPFPDFKQKFLYNKVADDIFREPKDDLLTVFRMHSGRDDTPGEAKTMSLAEYVELLVALGIDQEITERSFRLSFVRSKETTINETEPRSVHKKLRFVEWLEVMGRVAFAIHCTRNGTREVSGMQVNAQEYHACLKELVERLVARARLFSKKKKK